ncbi:MAG: 4Fe-4S binding protein [candidate division WOR-3 bacterium]|nr:4Fe-4S binding protein [candidate division WOR-3 bacterium]
MKLRIKRARIIRWTIQILFLGLFIAAFIQTRYSVPVTFQNLFFKFDPLILLVVSIAYRTFITAAILSLLIVAATIFFGRFFCGFVCPLGTTIDIFDVFVKKRKKTEPLLRNGKYLTLIFLLIAAGLGISFLHFLDPLAIFERTLTLVFYPAAMYISSIFNIGVRTFYTESAIAVALFSLILGLNFINRRFWCRNACPLGGLLALLSKSAVFKFSFAEGCTECGICEKVCPTDAISIEKMKVDSGECIDCLRCLYECPQNVLEYKISLAPSYLDLSRRQLIGALGASIIVAPLANSLLHRRLSGRLIRPPGSIPEPDFLDTCIHCGKCMKVCPTNGLQPCILEAGVNGLWTPRLAARIGGCEKNCNMCGQICPTSAIRNLSPEEKTYAKMGTAVIDRARCIAWEQDRVCLICDEACPYAAISSLSETVRNTTLLRPFIDEQICTGCGLCEARCPIEGRAAIEVYSIGEERMRRGSYITEEKIRLRACEEKEEDLPSGFIIDN